MKCVPDIPYDTSNGLMLDLYLPDRLNAKACIIYAHGGGFRKGDRQDAAAAHFAERLTSAGFAMATVSYRLNTTLETFSEQEQRYIASYVRRTSSIGFRLSPKLFGPAFIAATEDVSRAIEFLWVEGSNLGILSRKTG
ncbi:MAG: hypothetical protein OXD48_05250, partial [Litoreibacter sp.]|nr:hypothetical protein [Litoreibacter sp.]